MDRLPPELLYCIADYLLPSAGDWNSLCWDSDPDILALLRTCRRIYRVLSGFWYRHLVKILGQKTCFERAVAKGSARTIESFVNTVQPDPPFTEQFWHKYLEYSVRCNRYDTFSWLFKKNKEQKIQVLKYRCQDRVKDRNRLLHYALDGEDTRIAHVLLEEADDDDIHRRFHRKRETLLSHAVRLKKPTELIGHILERGATLLGKTDGKTAFDIAIERNRLDVVELFIRREPQAVNDILWHGFSYLWCLEVMFRPLGYSDDDLVRLVVMIFDNAPDSDDTRSFFHKQAFGKAALLHAFFNRRWGVAQKLIEKGMGLDFTAPYNRAIIKSALHFIAKQYCDPHEDGAVDTVKLLLDKGADLYEGLAKGTTLSELIQVTKKDQPSKAERLFEDGFYINMRDKRGYTVLHHTVLTGEIHKTRLLLKYGADANCCNARGESALLHAVREENIGLIDLLLAHGARTDTADAQGDTPMKAAFKTRNDALIQRLRTIQS